LRLLREGAAKSRSDPTYTRVHEAEHCREIGVLHLELCHLPLNVHAEE